MLKYEQVRLGVLDGPVGQGRIVLLQIELPTKVSAEKVSHHILERAVKFCLAHNTVPAEHLEALKALPQSQPDPKKVGGNSWMIYRLPYFRQAVPGSADVDVPAPPVVNPQT